MLEEPADEFYDLNWVKVFVCPELSVKYHSLSEDPQLDATH